MTASRYQTEYKNGIRRSHDQGTKMMKNNTAAEAVLAAKDAAHEKQINAYKSLIQSLENQRTTLREGAAKWAEAVKSLISEREANAILTSEIAALTAERDAVRKDGLRAATVAFGLMVEGYPDDLPEDAAELAKWLDVHAFASMPDDMGSEGLFIHIIRAAMTKDTK